MKKLLGIVVLGLLLSNCAPLDTSKWPSSYRTVTAETSDGNTYSYTHVTFLNAFGKNDFSQCKLNSYWYKIASKTFSEKTKYHVPDLAVTDCYSKQEAYKLYPYHTYHTHHLFRANLVGPGTWGRKVI